MSMLEGNLKSQGGNGACQTLNRLLSPMVQTLLCSILAKAVRAVLLLLVFALIPTRAFAGQVTVVKNGVTYLINWQNTSFTTDANGYLISPSEYSYNTSMSGGSASEAYMAYLGEYQGGHCYWNNYNGYPFSWYSYKVNNTQGYVVALLTANNAADLLQGPANYDPTLLGVALDGGPTETDAGGYTRNSYTANFQFTGMVDATIIFVPWAQVFAGSTTMNISPPVNTGSPSATRGGQNSRNPLGCPAEPVDTGTGAHFLNLPMLEVQGAQELDFVMDYDSIGLFTDVLGTGWSHNFEAWLTPLTNGTILLNWNAKKWNVFLPEVSATNMFTCSDVPVAYDLLTQNADGTFTLKEPSQRQLQFDATGRLKQIANPHGQAIQLSYQTTNLYPTRILEPVSGQSIYLSYTNSSNLLTQISDASGRAVNFYYDASNHLISLVKSSPSISQTFTFSYDSFGRILSEVNPEGVTVFRDTYDTAGRIAFQEDALLGSKVTSFSYDESQTNRIITSVIDRTGATNVYVHDQNYLLLSITDGLGNSTSFGYDAFGNKTAVTNALGKVQTFAYDGQGNMISSTDAAGQTTTSGYDTRNNLIFLTNAVRCTASFNYDASNNLISSVDFMTNQVTMAYDTNSQLIQSTSARGGVMTFVHTAGLLTSLTDAANNTTGMAYDAIGRLIAITNADGFVSTNAYDLNDNLIAASDGLGNTWYYTYDSAGRKLSSTDPLGKSTVFTYNGNGDLIATTNALGGVTTYTYDGEDRLASVTDANGHTRTLAYDPAGRLISVADALNHTNFFQYDAVGNLIAAVDALGITNQITTYDQRNQPILTQDAFGNQKRMSYDALQRLIQSVDPLNRTNAFAYDPLSRLTSATDPLSLVSQQQFDSDGNRTGVINPKLAQTSFAYDLANRLTGMTTATGKQTAYALNGRNLVTNVTQPSGAQTTLTYDGAGRLTQSQDSAGTIAYTYDNKGRALTISESGGTIIRQYDALDRLTNYTDVFGNVLQYAYDAVGNLTKLTYPDGKQVAYAYDAANRLLTVTDWDNRVTTYSYDADNRIINISHPNGTATTYAYDLDARVTQQKDIAAPTNIIYQVDYISDVAGQLVSETSQPLATPFLPTPVSMTFDADNALTSYSGQTVQNDANGNMTFGPVPNAIFATYTYDVRNRLTGAGGLEYAYDPAGNRVAITNGGNVTEFVVNPNAALSQVLLRIQNGVTNYYVYGAGLLYEVTPNGGTTNVLVHHYDYRGSTVALTDGGGNVTDRVSYSPYGAIVSRSGSTDTPFLFNGSYGVQTEANGLLNMRARYYNTTICRFVNPDPSGFHGGLNRYAHVRGNPVSMTDPFGLCAETPYQDVSRSELIQYSEIQSILENEALNEDRKGIQSRDFDLFALVLVGTQPLTEFGVGEAAENAPVVIGEPTSTQLEFAFARGAAVQTPGLTQAGELFVRVGATEESTIVTSGSYAMPESTFNAIGRNPSALKDALDLPGSPPKYFRYFSPRAGTPIQRGIVPGGQYGGQGGYDEVIFP